ncbi:hypothetical protein JCM18750_01010 [Halostagnicola bangensis]
MRTDNIVSAGLENLFGVCLRNRDYRSITSGGDEPLDRPGRRSEAVALWRF